MMNNMKSDLPLRVQTESNSKGIVPTEENRFDAQKYAIEVDKVSYSYSRLSKKQFVLNELNFKVPKGKIYALLGPSGCGKSTILKCITRILEPSLGNVNIPISSPHYRIPGPGIGYMPQELSLFPDLTIQETLWLFGRVSGMRSCLLQNEIDRWCRKFGIPPGHRIIRNLSGGQKRRVSLICAFLHNAILLVLDEPTVGIDPILRRTIWDFLIELTETKATTVLLTTHYIDEAKDAHLVGLMREGQILSESSPSDILGHFGESSLERCFFLICVQGEAEDHNKKQPIHANENPETQRLLINNIHKGRNTDINELMKKGHSIRLHPQAAFKKAKTCLPDFGSKSDLGFVVEKVVPSLIAKNFKLLKRNPFLVFLQLVLPALTVFLCGWCIASNLRDLSLAVVNDENPRHLSMDFLCHLSSYPINQNFFSNMSVAVESVKKGQNVLVLHIPDDFSVCLRNRIELGIWSSNAMVKCARIYLYADNTNQILSLTLHFFVTTAFERFEMEFLTKYSDTSPLIASLPIKFMEPIYGNMNRNFSEYITSSTLIVVIHFLAAALTGVNLILERQNGMLERFEVYGVTKTQIFVSQLLTNMLVVVFQVLLMLTIQFSCFDTVMKGSFVLAITLILLQGFCGMLFGLFISALSSNMTVAILIGMAALLPSLILCGFIWPLQAMPVLIQWFARFIPITQTNEGLRSVILRGWGLGYLDVQMALLSVVCWSVFFLIAAMLIFRAQK